MDTTRLQENISAMVDGELPDCDVELTMAALAGADGRASWHVYQLIGDVLRADAAGAGLSAAFGARLAVRLAQEAFPPALDDASAGDEASGVESPAQTQPGQSPQPPPPASPQAAQSLSPSASPPQPPGDSAAPAAIVTR